MITRAQAKELVIKKNSAALIKIIRASKAAIFAQGRGCFIDEYGVDYVDPKRNIRDAIGVLVPFYSNGKLKRHYGLISEEAQKPIVRVIQKTYHVEINIPNEYNRFVRTLQELQYIHDECFDDNKLEMSKFLDRCQKLEERIVC
jgi:hypothetical protein